MKKSLGRVVLAVVIAGLLTGGIAIASAATKVRTVTTAQGTTVDVIAVTGKVTEVSDASSTSTKGFMGMFRRDRGYAKITDDADGKIYTVELGREESADITMKVGDTVTIEGTVSVRGTENELRVWTFTGADGKTVTLVKADGTPNIETVTVAGTVTEVNQQTPPATGDTTRPVGKAMETIKVKQTDGTIVTVVLGHGGDSITVKVGDTVKVTGFKTPMDANTVMATEFTGADGKTVTLRGLDGMRGDGVPKGESVTVSGTVTEVTQPTATAPSTDDAAGDTTKPAPQTMTTIKIQQADKTIVTVILGRSASSITVKVGDAVKVTGFKMSTDATTINATSFTGADGKTITLQGMGGMRGGRGPRDGGRGFGGNCAPAAPTSTGS